MISGVFKLLMKAMSKICSYLWSINKNIQRLCSAAGFHPQLMRSHWCCDLRSKRKRTKTKCEDNIITTYGSNKHIWSYINFSGDENIVISLMFYLIKYFTVAQQELHRKKNQLSWASLCIFFHFVMHINIRQIWICHMCRLNPHVR